jgi:hypothetical protein
MPRPTARLALRATTLAAVLALAGCASAPDWKPAPPDQTLARADVPAGLPAGAGVRWIRLEG